MGHTGGCRNGLLLQGVEGGEHRGCCPDCKESSLGGSLLAVLRLGVAAPSQMEMLPGTPSSHGAPIWNETTAIRHCQTNSFLQSPAESKALKRGLASVVGVCLWHVALTAPPLIVLSSHLRNNADVKRLIIGQDWS